MSTVYLGDCVAWLQTLEPCSVDAIVCDPPYGLGFMGKKWDALPPGPAWAAACLRVLKPGAHLIAFGGTRTVHRLACALEDEGFDIRDTIAWHYLSGFPKSHDVSKALDAAAGAERAVVGLRATGKGNGGTGLDFLTGAKAPIVAVTAPATETAQRFDGWGTALKPSIEPAILARKPPGGTIAACVLQHGTGGLNIDATRYAPGDRSWTGPNDAAPSLHGRRGDASGGIYGVIGADAPRQTRGQQLGRWPANIYRCPKPSVRERERGCDALPLASAAQLVDRKAGSAGMENPRAGAGGTSKGRRNTHPTQKPVRLMRWLCRLVCPPGGLVVDPFTGSGTTGIAAALEGFRFAGAEMHEPYHRIATTRIRHALEHPEAWADTAIPRAEAPPADEPEPPEVVDVDELPPLLALMGLG